MSGKLIELDKPEPGWCRIAGKRYAMGGTRWYTGGTVFFNSDGTYTTLLLRPNIRRAADERDANTQAAVRETQD